ncbi:MAG TPA: hypothetical protein VGL13_16525, partial [Polyangiaceae bacterium]
MQARWIALLGCVTACSQTSSPGGAMPTGGAGGGDAMSAASGGSAGVDAADAANTEGGTDAAYTPGPAKTETLTITAGGRPRTVILHTPANLTTPTALVFNLHGSGGTAADQESYTQMDRDADRLGFIAAYGQGDIASGAGFVWNVPG